MPNYVPNEPARIFNVPYKIAIIGEAPGADEDKDGRPFVGRSGQFLEQLLGRAHILRSATLLGNVCQVRPPDNDIAAFNYDGPEIQHGLAELRHDIATFDPCLVVLLGKTALRAAGITEETITTMRGTFFICTDKESPFYNRKCMATYHPAACLRAYEWTPILAFDLKRARQEGTHPDWIPPVRNMLTGLDYDTLIAKLIHIRDKQMSLGFDIEGYGTTGITCLAFSWSAGESISVPFSGYNDGCYWSAVQEVEIWKLVSQILSNPNRVLLMQNGNYDTFVCFWRHRILVQCQIEDTMLASWELFSEFPKNLGFQCSIYTKEPYYKEDRTSDDYITFWQYNCKDTMVLWDILDDIKKQLKDERRYNHYRFNIELLTPMLYMQLRGTKFDVQGALAFRDELLKEATAYEKQIELVPIGADPTKLIGTCPNVQSSNQMKTLLYKTLGLPPQYKKAVGNKAKRETTEKIALYKLAQKTSHPALMLLLKSKKARRMASDAMSLTNVDDDGRVRCSLNLVGTDTGRLSSSGSPSGSGRNLQNITKKLRKHFKADTGKLYAQMDLSGADGWTVAARCDQVGYPEMWDDYVYGLKPAKILFLMLRDGAHAINNLSRAELKELSKSIDSDGKDYDMYFSCKRVQHGSNYKMGPDTVGDTILKDSEGIIWLNRAAAKRFQDVYFIRYNGVKEWWKMVATNLSRDRGIWHSSGHFRQCFGRPTDDETLRSACAEEPQGNTTYAIKIALQRLWRDPANRRENGSLIVEPTLTVHDSLNVQFNEGDLPFAKTKIHEWFNNPITIGNKTFSIPFEGNYGPSWGECKESL